MATKPRVYIETTIPSFYYEVREEPEMVARRLWTRSWWDDESQDYDLRSDTHYTSRAHSLEGGGVMRKDPAIDEIRQTRKEISQEYETTEAFLDHYRTLEKSYEARMLRTDKSALKTRTDAA